MRIVLVAVDRGTAAEIEGLLGDAGWVFEMYRVESEGELQHFFRSGISCDAAIAGYSLSSFGGIWALRLLGELAPGLPVILAAGRIGEEAAVEAVRAGAADVVFLDNLGRLPAVMEREVRDRRQMRAAGRRALKPVRPPVPGAQGEPPSGSMRARSSSIRKSRA